MQNFMEKPGIQKPNGEKVCRNDEASVSLHTQYTLLLDKAIEIPPDDPKTIEMVRELLLQGRLESPENIRAAAENIITFGI